MFFMQLKDVTESLDLPHPHRSALNNHHLLYILTHKDSVSLGIDYFQKFVDDLRKPSEFFCKENTH